MKKIPVSANLAMTDFSGSYALIWFQNIFCPVQTHLGGGPGARWRPILLQFFVQTSDQLKPPTTRYSSKNRSVVFNACWDESNSVKFVRWLTVNSFRNQELQVLHWHWQGRQCPSQAMKGSRSRYTLPTNLSTFFPCIGELCRDAYPLIHCWTRTMCRKMWLCYVLLFGHCYCLPNTVPCE